MKIGCIWLEKLTLVVSEFDGPVTLLFDLEHAASKHASKMIPDILIVDLHLRTAFHGKEVPWGGYWNQIIPLSNWFVFVATCANR